MTDSAPHPSWIPGLLDAPAPPGVAELRPTIARPLVCAVDRSAAADLQARLRAQGLVYAVCDDPSAVVVVACNPVAASRADAGEAPSPSVPRVRLELWTSGLARTPYALYATSEADADHQLACLSRIVERSRDGWTIKPPRGWASYGWPLPSTPGTAAPGGEELRVVEAAHAELWAQLHEPSRAPSRVVPWIGEIIPRILREDTAAGGAELDALRAFAILPGGRAESASVAPSDVRCAFAAPRDRRDPARLVDVRSGVPPWRGPGAGNGCTVARDMPGCGGRRRRAMPAPRPGARDRQAAERAAVSGVGS